MDGRQQVSRTRCPRTLSAAAAISLLLRQTQYPTVSGVQFTSSGTNAEEHHPSHDGLRHVGATGPGAGRDLDPALEDPDSRAAARRGPRLLSCTMPARRRAPRQDQSTCPGRDASAAPRARDRHGSRRFSLAKRIRKPRPAALVTPAAPSGRRRRSRSRSNRRAQWLALLRLPMPSASAGPRRTRHNEIVERPMQDVCAT